jgi:hypothetical protein
MKIKATALQIQAHIQSWIDEAKLEFPCDECEAPYPVFADTEKNDGCNWVTQSANCDSECITHVWPYVLQAQEKFELI